MNLFVNLPICFAVSLPLCAGKSVQTIHLDLRRSEGRPTTLTYDLLQ